MKTSIFNIISWVLTVAIAAAAGFFVYLYVFPHQNYYIDNEPMEVLSKTVREGEPVVYRAHVCVKRDVSLEYNAVLISKEGEDGEGLINFPSRSLSFKADPEQLCRDIISQTVVVPKGTPSGTWHIEFNINVYESPYPVRRVSYRTEDFEIIGVEPTENQININVNENQPLPELKRTKVGDQVKPVLIQSSPEKTEVVADPPQQLIEQPKQNAHEPEVMNLGTASTE